MSHQDGVGGPVRLHVGRLGENAYLEDRELVAQRFGRATGLRFTLETTGEVPPLGLVPGVRAVVGGERPGVVGRCLQPVTVIGRGKRDGRVRVVGLIGGFAAGERRQSADPEGPKHGASEQVSPSPAGPSAEVSASPRRALASHGHAPRIVMRPSG